MISPPDLTPAWRHLDTPPGDGWLLDRPDIPRGIDHLVRHLLSKGEPAVAMVPDPTGPQLATFVPAEDAVLVLLRPASGPLTATLAPVFAAICRVEGERPLPPEASATLLLRRLDEAGFPGLDALMAAQICGEPAAAGTAPDPLCAALDPLGAHFDLALAEQTRLVARFNDLLILPVNMRLVAARLEPQGGPLSQISANYKAASEEISRRLSGVAAGKSGICANLARALNQCRLNAALASLLETLPGPGLAPLAVRLRDRALQAVTEAARHADLLHDTSAELRRMILGLDTIRILARVESRRCATDGLPHSIDSLTATIDRIDLVQAAISDSLKIMSDRTAMICVGLDGLSRRTDRAA